MKAQIIFFIAFCIALASCKKTTNDIAPTQQLDSTVNLVGTWHIDSITYFSMNLENNNDLRPSFNAKDSLKFYTSLNQNLPFKRCTTDNVSDDQYYRFNYHAITFIKDSSITLIPLPGYLNDKHILLKQISNEYGMFTGLNSDYYYFYYHTFSVVDRDSIGFNISRISNKSIKLTLDPFIEYICYHNDCSGGYDIGELNGYYIKIYLTQTK